MNEPDETTDADVVVPDLRPNPWPVHGVIVLVLLFGYGLLAWAAWPPEHAPPSGGKLQDGLSVLVAVGEGAAAAAIIMSGVAVLFYIAVTTVILEYVRNPWLVHGLAGAAIALAALIASAG